MQTKLPHLRSQLNLLRRKRSLVRQSQAACRLLTFTLLLIWFIFAGDWLFRFSAQSRFVILIGILVAIGWGVKKWVPLLSHRESLEEVALIVEQQHHIDNDLVAALQFDQPQSRSWGSTRLTSAVVDYVAEFSRSLNVLEGFSYQKLPRRLVELGAVVLLVAGTILAVPQHTSAFWNRLLLGDARYPTRTQIQSLSVNGEDVPVFYRGKTHQQQIPFGVPIVVRARCEGAVPTVGYATLQGLRNDAVNRIELRPVPNMPGDFQGELSYLTESLRMRIEIGDATSDPGEFTIIPLPLVDVTWNVAPPTYASATLKQDDMEGSSRQIAVLDGSQARLKLVCLNKKLRSARLTTGDTTYDLVATGNIPSGRVSWSLPPNTPFENIRDSLKYEIQVTDYDGLSLESPVAGQIRLKSDRPPRIAATAVTRHVLPSAQPTLDYVAVDDFGIATVTASIQISRARGESSKHDLPLKRIEDQDQPQHNLRDQVRIPLSAYELVKGDDVKVSLRVSDWRGALPGQSAETEPVQFSVTDLSGILTQTGEEDRKSAKQLEEILQRELGISDEKK